MEQTEMKLVEKEGCCGGKACDAETQAKFEAEAALKRTDASRCGTEQQAPVMEMTKEMLIANVLELSMTVNRLNTEIGAMSRGIQQMVGEMFQAMNAEIEAIKKSINPQ